MTFSEKLKELRNINGLTQEELAEQVFVSRMAVSKWESGRGYPNLDSLKMLAKTFSVSVDDLLSSDEIITLAQEEKKKGIDNIVHLIVGILDVLVVLLFVIPAFPHRLSDRIEAVNLIQFESYSYIKIPTLIIVTGLCVLGVIQLACQNVNNPKIVKTFTILSLGMSAFGIACFTACNLPYASVFLLCLCAVKVFFLLKHK